MVCRPGCCGSLIRREGHPIFEDREAQELGTSPLTSGHPGAVNGLANPDPAQNLASILQQSFLITKAEALSTLNYRETIEILRGFAHQEELGAKLNKELCRTAMSVLREVHLAAKEREFPAYNLSARDCTHTLAEGAFDLLCEHESYEEDTGSENRDLDLQEKPKTINFEQTDTLHGWYKEQLWHMQQVPLKKICKAWIKKIHPKKSGKYPYNGGRRARVLKLQGNERGDLTRPRWWPMEVPHKEPDHLDQWSKQSPVRLLDLLI